MCLVRVCGFNVSSGCESAQCVQCVWVGLLCPLHVYVLCVRNILCDRRCVGDHASLCLLYVCASNGIGEPVILQSRDMGDGLRYN